MRSSYVTRALKVAGAFVLLVGAAAPVSAQTDASLAATARVENNCKITAGSVVFDLYDPIGANDSAALNGSGALTVQCTRGASPRIQLDAGANENGTQRRLHSGGWYLDYRLFSDSGRSNELTPSTWFEMGTAPSKAPRTQTVYASIAGNQDVPAGTYSDTVLATVDF